MLSRGWQDRIAAVIIERKCEAAGSAGSIYQRHVIMFPFWVTERGVWSRWALTKQPCRLAPTQHTLYRALALGQSYKLAEQATYHSDEHGRMAVHSFVVTKPER